MTPRWIQAFENVLLKFQSTYFDSDMTIKIQKAKQLGDVFKYPATQPWENPEYSSGLNPYVDAVLDVLLHFEKTYSDDDMVKRIRKVKQTTAAIKPSAANITRTEYLGYQNTISSYMPQDTAYLESVKNVLDRFESTFYDLSMNTLIRIAKASS